MERYFLALVFLVATFSSYAQGNGEPETLLGSGIYSVSGFGGMFLQFGGVLDEPAVYSGGGGAALFNEQFYVGGYGLGLSSNVDFRLNGTEYDLDFGHGGFMVGYIFNPRKLVHFGISTKLGWGSIRLNDRRAPGVAQVNDNTFSAIPQVDVELNVTQWFKIQAGLAYQYTAGVNNVFFSTSDFSGVNAGLSFLFGWFN